MERQIEYKGYTINIEHNDYAENPREFFEPAGTMVCWHRRYHLGDMEDGRPISRYYNEPIDLLYELAGVDRDEYWEEHDKDMSDAELYSKIKEKGTVILDLYLYDHSGISMSCSSYVGRAHHAEWDSGRVGYIYTTKDKIEKEGWTKEQATKYLEGEVETYDDYLTGNVYGYRIEDSEGEEKDSCWGYFGSPEDSGLVEDAKSNIDYYCKQAKEEYAKEPKKKAAEMYMV